MGQRLVIEIRQNDDNGATEKLANAYYHWSGYTFSSIEITENIIQFMNTHKAEDYENSLLYAIRILEASNDNCGLYCLEDLGDKYPNETFIQAEDRNCGLIEVSPKGIDNNASWADFTISINISTEKINFGVFSAWDREEYEQDYREYDYDGDPADDDIFYPYTIVDYSLDLSNLSFDDFQKMANLFRSNNSFIFKSNLNEVIRLIE